jgi:hypothetical protein
MYVDGGSQDRYPRILPAPAPTARFAMTPASPVVYEPVTFDASTSSTPGGTVVDFNWDFGDGLLDLVPYTGPAGFRVLVPKDWALHENATVGNRTVALQLLGPVRGNVATSILLDVRTDSSLQETNASLDAAMDTVVHALQVVDSTAAQVGAPLHRTIAGHLSVTSVIRYGSSNLFQRIVLVASAADHRSWTFTLTSSGDYYETSSAILERMLGGFEITLAPPTAAPVSTLSEGQIILAYTLGAAVVSFAIAGVLVARMNRRSKIPVAPPRRVSSQRPATPPRKAPSAVRGSTPAGKSVRFCPRCGAPAQKGGAICLKCGALLRS